MLFAVERDGSPYGVLRAAVTVAHSDFYSYVPAGSTWTTGREGVDGTLQPQTSPVDGRSRPVTAQEAQGHGLKAWPQYDINGDGLVYRPGSVAEVPAHGNDRNVGYRLADIFAPGGLWAQRDNPETFAGPGTFAGDDDSSTGAAACGWGTWDCGVDSANAPWGWDDGTFAGTTGSRTAR